MFSSRKAGFALASLTVLGLAAARPAAAQVTIANPSFEINPNTGYPGYGPISGWNGSDNGQGNNGFGTNDAQQPFANNGAIPDGSNVALLQAQNGTTTINQSLSGFTVGDQYVITFYDNSRIQSGDAHVTVTLGGLTIVPLADVSSVGGSNPYHFVTGSAYTATGTTATLAISNVGDVNDTTALVDDVKIQDIGAAPEPSQTAALGLGVLGLAGLALKARKRRAA